MAAPNNRPQMEMQYWQIPLVFEPILSQMPEGHVRRLARELIVFVCRMLAEHPDQLLDFLTHAPLLTSETFFDYFRDVWEHSIPPLFFDELVDPERDNEVSSPPGIQRISPPLNEVSSPPLIQDESPDETTLPLTVSPEEIASQFGSPQPEPVLSHNFPTPRCHGSQPPEPVSFPIIPSPRCQASPAPEQVSSPVIPPPRCQSPRIVMDDQLPGRSDGRSPLGLLWRIPQDNVNSDDEFEAQPPIPTPRYNHSDSESPFSGYSSKDDSSDGLSLRGTKIPGEGLFPPRHVSPSFASSPEPSTHQSDSELLEIPEGAMEKRQPFLEIIPGERTLIVESESEYRPSSEVEESSSDDSLFIPIRRSRKAPLAVDAVFGKASSPLPELVRGPGKKATRSRLPLASPPPKEVVSRSRKTSAAKNATPKKRRTPTQRASIKHPVSREYLTETDSDTEAQQQTEQIRCYSPPPQHVDEARASPPPEEVTSPAPQRKQKKTRKIMIIASESDEEANSPPPQLVANSRKRKVAVERREPKMYNVKKNRFVEALRRQNAMEAQPRPAPAVSSRVPYKPQKRTGKGKKQDRKKGGPFQCGYCPKEFGIRYNLTKHVRQVHTNPTIYTCGTCGRVYSSQDSFRYHMSTRHAAPGTYGYRCEICGEQFIDRFAKRHHKITRHGTGQQQGRDRRNEQDFSSDSDSD